MILLDANLLIYAHSASMPQHHAARAWLDEKLNGSGDRRISMAESPGVHSDSFESAGPCRNQHRSWIFGGR